MSVGGLLGGLGAFTVFSLTMGTLIFFLCLLGGRSTRALRSWGDRIQLLAALTILLVGIALVADAVTPRLFDRLILGH